MRDQRLADRVARADDQREHAFGQAAVGHRLLDRASDELGRAEMRRMRFHDDRTTRRERRRRVAARHRKREREIARAEHRDRSDGNLLQAQIRTRQRLAVGLRGIERRVEPAAFAHERREQPQLSDRARALAFETRFRQRRFGLRALDQRVAERDDVVRDRFEELRARFERRVAIGVERGVRQFAGTRDFRRAAAAERGFEVGVAGRVERAQRGVGTLAPPMRRSAFLR